MWMAVTSLQVEKRRYLLNEEEQAVRGKRCWYCHIYEMSRWVYLTGAWLSAD